VQVLVWTVNDPHAALTLADAGIGGVFSDDPGLIVAAFAQR
jgi:glycerophosphoryl diester phosphodiesterase